MAAAGGAAGDDENDVVFQELLHELDVGEVRTDLGIVAAYHGHSAPQHTGGDALQQGLGGAEFVHLGVGNAVQDLHNGLHGVTHPGLGNLVGDVHQVLVPVLEVFHCHFHNGLGVVAQPSRH